MLCDWNADGKAQTGSSKRLAVAVFKGTDTLHTLRITIR